MSKTFRAEALLTLADECSDEAVAAAKVAGVLAANRASELVPFSPAGRPLKAAVTVELGDGEARIESAVETETAGEAPAMVAAVVAALTLSEMTEATIRDVRPAERTERAPAPFPRKPVAAPAVRRTKTGPAKPAALMGEVVAPRPPKTGSTHKREAFRTFMTDRHLRATEWAKKAAFPRRSSSPT